MFEARDRKTGETLWTDSRIDLVFGWNSQLRALAEVHAADDASEKLASAFVRVWNKVMNASKHPRRSRKGGNPYWRAAR